MSKLGKSKVKHVANLSKLPLTAAEIEKFSRQLSQIVDFVEQLNEVDTSNVEPTHQTTGLQGVYRNDEASSEDVLSQKEALSGSKKVHNGYFVVPAILKGKNVKKEK